MTIDRIRAAGRAEPFRPFTVRLLNGRGVHVAAPECLLIASRAERQFVVAERGEEYTVVTVDSVESIEYGRGVRWMRGVWRRYRGFVLGSFAVVLGSVLLTWVMLNWGLPWYHEYRFGEDRFFENPEAAYRAALDSINDPEWAANNAEYARSLQDAGISIDHFRSLWSVELHLLMDEHVASGSAARGVVPGAHLYGGPAIQRSGYADLDEVQWMLNVGAKSPTATLSIFDTDRACGDELFEVLRRKWSHVAPMFKGEAAVGLVEAGEQVIRNVRHNMSTGAGGAQRPDATRRHESLASTGFYNVTVEATTEERVDADGKVIGNGCIAHLYLTLTRTE